MLTTSQLTAGTKLKTTTDVGLWNESEYATRTKFQWPGEASPKEPDGLPPFTLDPDELIGGKYLPVGTIVTVQTILYSGSAHQCIRASADLPDTRTGFLYTTHNGIDQVELYVPPQQPDSGPEIPPMPGPGPQPEQPGPEPPGPGPQPPESPGSQPGDVQIEVHAGQTVVVEVKSSSLEVNLGQPIGPRLSVFPRPYPNSLRTSVALQAQLDSAIKKGPGESWRTPVAIVSLEDDGTRPFAQFKGAEVHYSASLVKVAAMYAAFELRKTVRDVVWSLGDGVPQDKVLGKVAMDLDLTIMNKARAIPALSRVSMAQAVPKYAELFAVTKSDRGFDVEFTSDFAAHLELMIAASDNDSAALCIQRVGYGYLNGALASAGLFDSRTNNGIWLAGDYISSYAYYRIKSENDGLVAQAATASQLARMYTLINDGALVDRSSCEKMKELLKRPRFPTPKIPKPEQPYIDRSPAIKQDFEVIHSKLGLGDLKPENGRIYYVQSEASIVRHRTTGRKFVVAWQNYRLDLEVEGWDRLGKIVRDAINGFVYPT